MKNAGRQGFANHVRLWGAVVTISHRRPACRRISDILVWIFAQLQQKGFRGVSV
jgi:hypothetical protein